MKRIIFIILLVLAVCVFVDKTQDSFVVNEKPVLSVDNLVGENQDESKKSIENQVFSVKTIETVDKSIENEEKSKDSVKKEKNLADFSQNIDFVPQAPDANWELPYKEACEEASLIMAIYGINGENLDKTQMDQEILDLVMWQNQVFGYYEDTNAAEIVRMSQEYYGKKAFVVDNPSINQIKSELDSGNLIVAVLTGREIGNPYFVQPGPLYHALLIHGYDQDEFITHDPGTRRGENYKYKQSVIMDALHDWNDGEVYSGVARIIVITSEKI